jgi:choline/glycine/proline betaine transport protein
VLLAPTLVSFAWFTIFGNTALEIDGVVDEVNEVGEDVGMFALLENLGIPAGLVTGLSVLTIFVVVVFFVTSSDSGSFVIDMLTSGGDLHPAVQTRVFWAVTEGAVAAALLLAGGDRRARGAAGRRHRGRLPVRDRAGVRHLVAAQGAARGGAAGRARAATRPARDDPRGHPQEREQRERELELKAKELDLREQELEQWEEELAANGGRPLDVFGWRTVRARPTRPRPRSLTRPGRPLTGPARTRAAGHVPPGVA